jgi:transcriptional regulator with XRE-family HTH domain
MGSSITASNLRLMRERRDLTQEQLAVAAGLTSKTIRNLEQGGSPRVGTLSKLAEALNCSVEDLIEPLERLAA